MFYVVKGYCGPDHYTSDNGPVLKVVVYDSAGDVEAAYKEFREELPAEATRVTFRVIEGVERKLRPVEIVTEYKLG